MQVISFSGSLILIFSHLKNRCVPHLKNRCISNLFVIVITWRMQQWQVCSLQLSVADHCDPEHKWTFNWLPVARVCFIFFCWNNNSKREVKPMNQSQQQHFSDPGHKWTYNVWKYLLLRETLGVKICATIQRKTWLPVVHRVFKQCVCFLQLSIEWKGDCDYFFQSFRWQSFIWLFLQVLDDYFFQSFRCIPDNCRWRRQCKFFWPV